MSNGIQSTNEYGGAYYTKPADIGVEKNKKWYNEYALYVASKYNFIIPRFNNVPLAPNEIAERWATRVLLNEAYVKAEQVDELFKFMGNDEQNNPLPTKFIKETTPYVIFKHIWGNIRKNCMTLPKTVFANAIHNEALQDKNLSINMAKMKIDFAEEFEELKVMGMDFQPMGNQEFQSPEDVDDYADNMQDAMACFFTASAKDFLYSQHWEEKCSKMAEYLIPSYFCRVELYPEKEDIEWKVIRPAQCIWDNTFDDELGRRQRFQGIVENCSVPQLFAQYDWTAEEKAEINRLATEIPNNSDTIMQLNNMQGVTNLIWWGMLSKVPSIAVVKARWISWDEENDCETWYQCDLVGNKWPKNMKKCGNVTYNKDGSMNTPFLDFIPEMTYGINSSIIYKMRQISGMVTGINAKINALIARAKGKVPVFFGDKIPTGTTQAQLLKMVASGLVFLKGADIDDIMNNPDNKARGLMDVMDLTAAVKDIQVMRSEVMYWENKMRDLASIPLVALGSQTEIIGAKVQNQTIEQSTYGMLPLYHGFMLYINNILNVASQMKQGIISKLEDKKKYALQVSPKQFKYFEVTKEFSLPDLQIYLSQSDALDEAERAHVQAIAERESSIPNSWLTALDAIELMTFSTKTEMINYLRYKKKAFDEKQARAEAAAAAQEQQMQQEQLQTQAGIASEQGNKSLENTAMKGDQKKEEIALKALLEDSKPEPTK